MAKVVDKSLIMQIITYLEENNANQRLGIGISDISHALDVTGSRVRRIVTREDLGFALSHNKSLTGAHTYYHDFEKAVNIGTAPALVAEMDPIQQKDQIVAHMVNALSILDPLHEIVQKAGPVGKSQGKGGKQKRGFWDWLFIKDQEAFDRFNEKNNAKEFLKKLDEIKYPEGVETNSQKYKYYFNHVKSDKVTNANIMANATALLYYGILSQYDTAKRNEQTNED